MNVRKFIGANAREALRKVKETLGPDAIILSNRSVGGDVEIIAVASRDMAMIVPPVEEKPPARAFQRPLSEPRPAPVAPTPRAAVADEDDYRVSLSQARMQSAANPTLRSPLWEKVASPNFDALLAQKTVARAPEPELRREPTLREPAGKATVNVGIPRSAALKQAVPAPEPQTLRRPETGTKNAEVVPVAVVDEIRMLRKLVEQHLAGFAWGEVTRAEPVKAELMRQMLDSGFSPQFARELLLDLPHELDLSQARAWARGSADRSLYTLSSDRDLIDRGGAYALVGPTGVGKTTTAAKLAARCVLRHGASRVALVTTDSYRIGAYEQLRIYGRILGIPVHLARDAAELGQILNELSVKHMVLIDTMGMSQKDKLVLEQNAMLSACGVTRLLTLTATARGDTLDDVARAYRGDELSGCVLTKIDESVSLAPALDVVMRHGLTLAYVSNGQRVPEDLHLPNRAYLLHRAFKEAPETAHRLEAGESGLMMASAGLFAAGGRRG